MTFLKTMAYNKIDKLVLLHKNKFLVLKIVKQYF